MNDNLEKTINLRFAKELERIDSEVEGKRRVAIADLSRRGMRQSGMTVQTMLDTGLERLDRLARAKYSCIKQAHIDSGERITPELLREFERKAEEILQDADQQVANEIKEKYPTLSVTVSKIGGSISVGIEGIKARLRRDSEIEATTLEAHSQRQIDAESSKTFSSPAFDQYQYDVFVSLANVDQAIGERIRQYLLASGIRVFFSPKDLQTADEWAEVVRSALVASREICLVISKRSLAREWVLTEWGAGWALQRRITTILVDCQVQDLPLRLQGKHCVQLQDLSKYVDEVSVRSSGRRASYGS